MILGHYGEITTRDLGGELDYGILESRDHLIHLYFLVSRESLEDCMGLKSITEYSYRVWD